MIIGTREAWIDDGELKFGGVEMADSRTAYLNPVYAADALVRLPAGKRVRIEMSRRNIEALRCYLRTLQHRKAKLPEHASGEAP